MPIISTDNWVYLIIGRVITGIGSSATILGIFKIIRMYFKEQFTRMLGFSITIGFIGAIYGGGPINYLCTTLGYKIVIQIFIVTGLLLAGIIYFITPSSNLTNSNSITMEFKKICTNYKVIMISISAGLMVGPLEGFADVWGSQFLKQVYGFDSSLASYIPSMIFIGLCFGSPLLSIIAEKTGNYIGSIIVAGFIMLIIFIMLLTGRLTINSMIVSFIILGICCAYQVLAICKIATYVPDNAIGLSTAVINMVVISFGYVFHSSIGIIIDLCNSINKTQPFIYGISIIPIALSMGIIGFLILAYKEKVQLT